MPDPADYYREIYARGLGGETPAIPVAVAELEQRAREAMDPKAANYVWAGAGSEDTIDDASLSGQGATTERTVPSAAP